MLARLQVLLRGSATLLRREGAVALRPPAADSVCVPVNGSIYSEAPEPVLVCEAWYLEAPAVLQSAGPQSATL